MRRFLSPSLARITPLRRQAGDTLIEVLIACSIISLVLTVAYGTTNRNIAINQDTQERSQALQIAQQQIELLRALSQSGADSYSPGDRCIIKSGSTASFSSDVDECKFSRNGSPSCTDDTCYRLTLTYHSDATSESYRMNVEWDSLKGGISRVALDYRV